MAYTIISGLVIVTVAAVSQVAGWAITQVQMLQAEPVSEGFWPGMTAVVAVVAALAAAPLLLARRHPRVSMVGVVWLVSALALGLLGVTRVVPIAAGDLGLAVQVASCLVLAGALWPILRVRPETATETDGAPAVPAAIWWAGGLGAATVVPWAWAGALGSGWETAAAAAAAVAFGVLCAVVLGDRFWRRFATVTTARRIFGGGSAAGVALLLLATGLGGAGIHLLTMLTIPAVAFAVAALMRREARCGRVVAVATAPVAFGPLAFGDADEFLPLILGGDFGMWLFLAGLVALLIAWGGGLFFGLTVRRVGGLPSLAAASAVIIVAIAGAVYGVSQPGFHGEKLFVVMAEQADLSGVTGDRDDRLEEVHRLLRDTAESTQSSLRAELDDAGLSWRPFYLVNAIEVDADLWHRAWLSERDDVAAVLLSPQNRPVPVPEPAVVGDVEVSSGPQPNIDRVGAPAAWGAGYDGSGITIGIADSGVDRDHPAFADRFRGGGDSWADPVRGTTEPQDSHGHGTHALGLALGADGIGVAPGADWMACSNLPRNSGNPGDYVACLEFMLAPYAPGEDPFTDGDPSRAPHIVTNSWGCPPMEGCDSDVLGPAVSALASAGVFVVVAAGNTGPVCGSAATPPANYRDAFSVGAVDGDNVVTSFSSRGPVPGGSAKPDLVAPGLEKGALGVVSSVPGGGFTRMAGTSMAAPHVAGAVAVLWQAYPQLVGEVEATADLLRETAAPVTEAAGSALDACGSPANTVGAGALDVSSVAEA